MPLPYIEVRDTLGPLPFHPFGVLVACGVLVGSVLVVRRAVARGLDRAKMESLASYVLVFAFVMSHVLDVLMYRPRDALKNPLELLMIWRGISSYGGFVGCLMGAVVWRITKKTELLPYGDQIAAVFPLSWIFGRAGCSIAHDHPGRLSSSPLAIDFPPGLFHPSGPRFDLGFLELLATIPIAIIVLLYARKPRPAGAVTGLLCMLYAPMRFPLDALRATDVLGADARYGGLTPAQWLSIALFFAGLAVFLWSRRRPAIGLVPGPVPSV